MLPLPRSSAWNIVKIKSGVGSKKLWRALCEKYPYSEIFWSLFSRIWTEYGDLLCKCPNSLKIRENVDEKNFECAHFLRSGSSQALYRKVLTYQNNFMIYWKNLAKHVGFHALIENRKVRVIIPSPKSI